MKSHEQQDCVVLKLINEKRVWFSSSEWFQCSHNVDS